MVVDSRALVRTYMSKRLRRTVPTARPELVRAAHAHGLDTELIDIGALAAVPAPELIEKFWLSAPIAGRVWRMGRGFVNCAKNNAQQQQRQAYKRTLGGCC